MDDAEVLAALRCQAEGCGGRLKFVRWSWARTDGKCKVIFRAGRSAIVVFAHYHCEECGGTCSALDLRLRRQLPPRVRADYPVSLAHAPDNVNWHLGQTLEKFIDHDSVTYEGCRALVKRQCVLLAETYDEQRLEWSDHVRACPPMRKASLETTCFDSQPSARVEEGFPSTRVEWRSTSSGTPTREGDKRGHIRGANANCKPHCDQWRWMVANHFRKAKPAA